MHHIVSDGRSVALLLQEIINYYVTLRQGGTPVITSNTVR